MKTSRFVNAPFLPPVRYLTLKLFVPDHLSARGFVGLAVLVGKVELNKPIVIYCLRERLKFGDLFAVHLNLFVDTSENGRYTKGKIALIALARAKNFIKSAKKQFLKILIVFRCQKVYNCVKKCQK